MPYCISVHKSLAQRAIRELKERDLIDTGYTIARAEDLVIIPVKIGPEEWIELSFGKVPVFECSPQPKARPQPSAKLPSLDLLGKVVILRENVLQYMSPQEVISSIRQVYPYVRAIWVKEGTVDTYRRPILRLLWGEEIREVVVREYGIKFKVVLGDVYYNPRLAEEHHRVAKMVRKGEVVVDAFSGIGCFALHIASSVFSLIIANDINPVAYELLLENIKANARSLKGVVIPLNLDAADLPSALLERKADRVIADLPLKSLEYASTYERLLRPGGSLHLYVHSSSIEDTRDAIAESFRGWRINECRLVLEYSPRTGIYRCDLTKPHNVEAGY